VLVLSTDPAHSLGDALKATVGARPRRIPTRAGRLDAVELDAPAAVERWVRTRRPALSRLLDEGTLLDREDISRVLGLPLPGIDELAGFLVLADVERTGAYDSVVLDTAPTGHTLRLLEMPALVGRLVALLDAMLERHAAVVRALGGHAAASELIEELRNDAAVVDARLRARASFWWVTLAEPVTVRETIDGIDWLRRGGFQVTDVVVNRITPEPGGQCAECRARITDERRALTQLAKIARLLPVRAVNRQPREPRGPSALRPIARQLADVRTWTEIAANPRDAHRGVRRYRGPVPRGVRPLIPPAAPVGLLLFGGKGGVGKSTCAAAVALAVANAQATRRIRLVSTDPAPSLGAVLQMNVGDAWRRVPGRWHLEARELDAAAKFAHYRERYREAVGDFFERVHRDSGFEARADRAVFERLFDLAPPGVDEVMGLLSVLDTFGDRSDDLVVVDTAPSGHTARLLALPADVQQWVAVLMRLVIKYRLAARAETLASDLLALSRGIRAFRARLADPSRAWFVAVARPAILPRLETARLLADVRRQEIRTAAVVVNAATGGTCARCRAAARGETRESGRIARACEEGAARGSPNGCAIIHAPLQIPPPSGVHDLLDWVRAWRVVKR
jgi:arsenite-transporting ATPase